MRVALERINWLWFLTLGVTITAIGILVYIYLLESVYGPISIREAMPREQIVLKPKVAILQSAYTRNVQRQINPRDTADVWYTHTLNWWERFLYHRGITVYSRLTDEDVESGALSQYSVLILPATHTLSDQEITEIKRFLQQGGNVLATWIPGIYRPGGSWRGWSFVEETFGLLFEGYISPGISKYQVYADTFPGYTPPGLYRPKMDVKDVPPSDPYKLRMYQAALQAHFPPLKDYVWVDSLGAPFPSSDFVLADTITIRRGSRRIPAVVLTYYTWLGTDARSIAPYPTTGPGIRRLTLRANTPLTAGIPAGYRLKVTVYDTPVQFRIAEPRTKAVGFWHDFFLEEAPIDDPLRTSTGAVYGMYGRGRFAYFSFPLTNTGVDQEDQLRLDQLSNNTMDWLRRRAVTWVPDWPYPYTAAALLAGKAETQPQHLLQVVRLFERERIQGAFFVHPERLKNQTLLQQLYSRGDVGVMDSLIANNQGPIEAQTQRLSRLRQQLEAILQRPVAGYMPTRSGMLGSNTLSALVNAGYRYFLPDSIGRRDTPKIMGYPYQQLTRFNLTAHTDEDVLIRAGDNPELRAVIFNQDIQRILYEGGMYTLVYSSDILASPPYFSDLERVVRTLKQHNFWLASGIDLEYWWRLKQGLHAHVDTFGKRRIRVRISNDNGASVDRLGVWVALGYPVRSIKMVPEIIGTPLPEYRFADPERTLLFLDVRNLKPQQYRNILIDLELEEDAIL